jgi:6-hydroxymethylpterin diphosphokinase MptE-like
LQRIGSLALANAKRNHSEILAGRSILDLRKTFPDGRPALVIAAGPSLHRKHYAREIAQHGFGGTIIATESSMSWCLRNGLVPDLVVTVDPHPSRIVRWFGDPMLGVDEIGRDDYFARQDLDPAFRADQLGINRELLRLVDQYGPRMKLAIASSASEAVVCRAKQAGMELYWWNPFLDDHDSAESLTRRIFEANRLPCVNAGGNVGTASWVIAHSVLGSRTIGLIGIDFGYYSDTPYQATQYYREIVDLFGKDALDDIYIRIVNPHLNEEFFTDPAYFWYRNIFLEMAEEAARLGVKTYNCTGGGILFGDNVTFLGFERFLCLVAR